jgi:hypothetical protein
MDRVDAVFIRNVHEDQAALQIARYKELFPTKEAEAKLRVFRSERATASDCSIR